MSEINMTPMIDVLLVLLIIFMVVQQGLQRGLIVQVPPPKEKEEISQKPPDDEQIVLEVEPGPKYAVNRQPVEPANLESFLRQTFVGRPRKVIFIKGAENLTYGDVVRAVDASRAADIAVVGLVPRPEVGPATVVAPPAQ
ncbi:MAG TPA: biopolymer transporter ExbD [Longimicrobium sp.]|jgi:biopolymer transport protein ExbD/biopolymer transport protein TolR|uniref:ExbD/TolR family protein n=1 Tax=Longimicrobium sp. TaxID=2029185 RepID=UPI002EDA5F39